MSEPDKPIDPYKARLIDRAFDRLKIKSFVDLGACWGVNGGYALHALTRGKIDRAVIVDGLVTNLTRERAKKHKQLEIVDGALGAPEVVEQVGQVDCAIMYDILLHQVSPDWDEFLALYAKNVQAMILYNQNWIGDPRTVRFIEFGLEQYLERVPNMGDEAVREWFAKHDEWCEKERRPWRDVHYFWQWGITQKDLVNVLWDLGFRVELLEARGAFDPRYPESQIDALICTRR